MNLENNVILATDSYKLSHEVQYPPDTKGVYSYLESRGGKYPYTVFFGLQYILKRYLSGKVVTEKIIDEAEEIIDMHMGPNVFRRQSWEHILDAHDGMLPLKIKAVPEGMCVPIRNVLMTVENTDPACFWLPGHVETTLLRLWYSITVATQSNQIRKLMDWYARDTGNLDLVKYRMHDFGYRGVSSEESAGIGGCAHLTSFGGSDTIAAIRISREYYDSKMPSLSIPASEHSTITSWGREHEVDAMRNMLTQFPSGIIACVSDSYDIFNACDKIWGEELKDMVLSRNGTTTIRPDSGSPLEIVMDVIRILNDKFGHTVNEKGYKVLDSHIRIIQGDGVNCDVIDAILGAMKHERWSIDNISFGAGGSLLQELTRDTQKFAFKCSAIKRNSTWIDVMKDPITDKNKKSKAGRMKLVKINNIFRTVPLDDPCTDDVMETVFEDGKILRIQTLDEIRKRLGTI